MYIKNKSLLYFLYKINIKNKFINLVKKQVYNYLSAYLKVLTARIKAIIKHTKSTAIPIKYA